MYKRQVLPAVVWNLFIFVKEPKRATAIRWTKYGSVIKTGNVLAAADLEPVKGMMVGLHADLSDSAFVDVYKRQPSAPSIKTKGEALDPVFKFPVPRIFMVGL